MCYAAFAGTLVRYLPRPYACAKSPRCNDEIVSPDSHFMASELLPRSPVRSAHAWTGLELARDPHWQFALAPLQEELDTALNDVLRQGLTAGEFAREQFHAPGFSALLDDVQRELIEGRGCALLRGLDVSRYDLRALHTLYWGIAVHLGVPISQNARGELIAHVTDSGREYASDNVRGYTTNDALKPHCDGCDVVGLLCAQTGAQGGESVLASSITIFNIMLTEYPHLLPHLAAGFHFDLRGQGATGDPDEVTHHKVPVFSVAGGLLSARYNAKTIIDGQRKAGDALTGERLSAVQCVGEIALRDDVRYDMAFERGDIQLLNNHTVLHARNAFIDAGQHKRDLLRLWLNWREPWPLAPALANRFNTGPRAGVAIRGIDY